MANVLKGAVGSLTGGIEKGYLLIKKAETLPNEPQSTRTPLKSGGSAAELGSAAKKLNQIGQKLNAASEALKGMSKQVKNSSNGYIPIQLQYNPSSIQISTMKGDILNRSAGGVGENVFQQWTVPVQTTMSVDLIFDDMNVMDAFNFENIISISGMRDLGKQMYGSRKSAGGFSVRPLVEAVVGAMSMDESRQVVFVWNQMAFDGSLVGVDTEYTMFNRLGEPIRAKVRIQIFQQNITKTKNGDQTVYIRHDISYWEEAYGKLFASNYAGGGSNVMQHLNKASNLINL